MFPKLTAIVRSKAIALLAYLLSMFVYPISASQLARNTRGMTTEYIIGIGVGILLLGIFLPIGLEKWESYVPTDPTLAIIWPIGAVLIVLGVVLKFYKD